LAWGKRVSKNQDKEKKASLFLFLVLKIEKRSKESMRAPAIALGWVKVKSLFPYSMWRSKGRIRSLA